MADKLSGIFTYVKTIIKKSLKDIKILQINYIMICISHKILVLLKITKILKPFLRSIIDIYFLKNE